MKNMFIILLLLTFNVTVQAQGEKHCNNPEYKLLETQFSDLDSVDKEWFFVLDKECMQELGLTIDDIDARRTVFLMGSMNYEGYGEQD